MQLLDNPYRTESNCATDGGTRQSPKDPESSSAPDCPLLLAWHLSPCLHPSSHLWLGP